MKKIILFGLDIVILFAYSTCMAGTPHQIAGFVLGHSIEEYKEKVRMETALPIRDYGYLKEVQIKDMGGFKSGLIWYGICLFLLLIILLV